MRYRLTIISEGDGDDALVKSTFADLVITAARDTALIYAAIEEVLEPEQTTEDKR